MITRRDGTPDRTSPAPDSRADTPDTALGCPVRARSQRPPYLRCLPRQGPITESGADEPMDEFAKRFLGADTYLFPQPGEKRLIAQISVDRIAGFGPKMQPWS